MSENVDHALPELVALPIMAIGIPSTWSVISVPLPPWADKTFPLSPCVPPTSDWLADTLGIVVPSVANDLAVGSASSSSLTSVLLFGDVLHVHHWRLLRNSNRLLDGSDG